MDYDTTPSAPRRTDTCAGDKAAAPNPVDPRALNLSGTWEGLRA